MARANHKKQSNKETHSSAAPLSTEQRQKREEFVFATQSSYLPLPATLLCLVGSFFIGLAMYALWVIEPPTAWSSLVLLVALLTFGLGLFHSSLSETSVAVGDAGLGIYDGKERISTPWFKMKHLSASYGWLRINTGAEQSLSINIQANLPAVQKLVKEAQRRTWCKVELNERLKQQLEKTAPKNGLRQEVNDVQIVGRKCAASQQTLLVEADACFCATCSQIFNISSVPQICPECQKSLTGTELKI